MKRTFGIISALCFAFALCFSLVGCGGGVDKSLYVGTWSLESSTREDFDADSIALMKTLGLELTLSLDEQGAGNAQMFGTTKEITWEATSDTEGTLTIDGDKSTLSLADGKLTVTEASGDSVTFTKTSETPTAAPASAVSSSAASSSAAAASSAAAVSDEAADAEAADEPSDDETWGDEEAWDDESADDEESADEEQQ